MTHDESLRAIADRLRYKRGYRDAKKGDPPAEASEAYLDGYREGRREVDWLRQAYSRTRGK